MTRNVAVVLLCFCVLAIVLLAAAVREREDKTLLLPPYVPEMSFPLGRRRELFGGHDGGDFERPVDDDAGNHRLRQVGLLRVVDPRLRALEARWSKVVGEVRKRKITTAFYPRLRADVDAQAVVVRFCDVFGRELRRRSRAPTG